MKRDNILDALAALDDHFSQIEGYDVVADGIYWTVVERVDLKVTATGKPKVTWSLKILGPDHFGCQVQRIFVVTSESLKWLKRDLFLCGLALDSLSDLPDRLENLLNLKLKVRKQGRAVHILDTDSPMSAEGHLFLHLVDEQGKEYLDQQLLTRQEPEDQKEFEAVVDHFVYRYQCPRPHKAYVEDAKTGETRFRMESKRK